MAMTIEEIDRRVTALEAAQNDNTQTLRWVVAKLGKMEATQQEHTLRLERIEAKIEGLAASLPGIVGDAIRAARE